MFKVFSAVILSTLGSFAYILGGVVVAGPNLFRMLAQVTPTPGTDWLGILAAYGVAAPFALLCLYFIRELRSENKELRDRLVDSFIPELTLSNKLHTETAQVLNETMRLVNTMSGAPVPDAREINRATDALTAVIERAEKFERDQRRS